jgi:hypothetical protein
VTSLVVSEMPKFAGIRRALRRASDSPCAASLLHRQNERSLESAYSRSISRRVWGCQVSERPIVLRRDILKIGGSATLLPLAFVPGLAGRAGRAHAGAHAFEITGTGVPYRVGAWLPSDRVFLDGWLQAMIQKTQAEAKVLHPVIADFQHLIESDQGRRTTRIRPASRR